MTRKMVYSLTVGLCLSVLLVSAQWIGAAVDGAAPGDKPVTIHLTMSGPAAAGVPTEEPAEVVGENLVRNSSFEASRWPGIADYWGISTWIDLAPSEKASGQETDNPFHGKYCYRIVTTSPGAYDAQVGTEWQRYSITVNSSTATHTRVNVRHRGSGNLCLDALQAELGDQATAYQHEP